LEKELTRYSKEMEIRDKLKRLQLIYRYFKKSDSRLDDVKRWIFGMVNDLERVKIDKKWNKWEIKEEAELINRSIKYIVELRKEKETEVKQQQKRKNFIKNKNETKENKDETLQVNTVVDQGKSFGGRDKIRCRNCRQFGHFANDCKSQKNTKCDNCHKEGHFKKECPERQS
jgi:hypothetical protein